MSAQPAYRDESRDTSGRWVKGVSGNAKGRKPAPSAQLAKAVREEASPEQLAAWYSAIWKGDAKVCGFEPTPQQRYEAGCWLANRGYGKEVAFKEQEEGDALGFGDASGQLVGRLQAVASGPDAAAEG